MREQRGFSLLEVLVAMALTLLVMLALLTVYTDMLQIRRRTEVHMEIEQKVRFILTTLSNHIQMTGFQTLRDVAFIPDVCDGTTGFRNSPFCAMPERSRSVSLGNVPMDGIILMVPRTNRRFFRPSDPAGTICQSTDGPTQPCGSASNCGMVGTNVTICTPSGFDDNQLSTPISQNIVGCGIVAPNTCPRDGNAWFVPNNELPWNDPLIGFAPFCGVPLNNAEICCVVRRVTSGPTCSSGTARTAPGGPCSGQAPETLTVEPAFPNFTITNARCQDLPPVDIVHYQVHDLPDPASIHPDHPGIRRFLMVRRNDGNFIPLASDVEDMQICYTFDPACDPQQACYRWGTRPNCQDTGAPPTIRRVRAITVQITVRSAQPLLRSIPRGLNRSCDPGLAPPPDVPPPEGNRVWHQITACSRVILRNIAYNTTLDWF